MGEKVAQIRNALQSESRAIRRRPKRRRPYGDARRFGGGICVT